MYITVQSCLSNQHPETPQRHSKEPFPPAMTTALMSRHSYTKGFIAPVISTFDVCLQCAPHGWHLSHAGWSINSLIMMFCILQKDDTRRSDRLSCVSTVKQTPSLHWSCFYSHRPVPHSCCSYKNNTLQKLHLEQIKSNVQLDQRRKYDCNLRNG